MFKQFLCLLFIIYSVTSCGALGKKDKSVDNNSGKINNIVESSNSFRETQNVYNRTRTVSMDLIHTKLTVDLEWEKSYLNGQAELTVSPRLYSTDSLVLDAKGMQINKVKLVGGSDLNFVYNGTKLAILLDRVYKKTDTLKVWIDYVAKPNEFKSTYKSNAISDDKGLYFINPTNEQDGFMPQVWTQGETESNSVWFPTMDSPNMKTTQEILVTVDDKYITLSNGKLVSSTKNTNGTRTDYWKQDLPHAPYLVMLAVGEFKIIKDFVALSSKKIDVDYYVEPEWETSAKAIFGETPQMIKYFSELLGVEFPWDKYHQIVVREYVSGAMENTTASVFGDFVYKTEDELIDKTDESIIAHELFHQWFGDLVTCESWANLPLNESFANYSQYLWDEYKYGRDEADFNAESEKRSYFGSYAEGNSHDMIWFDYPNKELMFDHHSYAKGGRLLHMLRHHIGDEAFFAGLNVYLKTNQFKSAEIHHLRMAFEEVTGMDLNWFFNQWFLESSHPKYELSYQVSPKKDSVSVVLKNVGENFYQFPVNISLVDEEGRHVYNRYIYAKSLNIIKLPLKGKMKSIVFDSDQILLAEIQETKSEELFRNQFYSETAYLSRKKALINGLEKNNLSSQELIMAALKDPFWDIKNIALGFLNYLTPEQLSQIKKDVQQIIFSKENSKVRSTAISKIPELFTDSEAKEILYKLAKDERSPMVSSKTIEILNKYDEVYALGIIEKLKKDTSSRSKIQLAKMYASVGKAEHLRFYDDLLDDKSLTNSEKTQVIGLFKDYLIRQDIETIRKANSSFEKIYSSNPKININYKLEAHYGVFENLTNRISKITEGSNKKELDNDKELAQMINVTLLYQNTLMKQIQKLDK